MLYIGQGILFEGTWFTFIAGLYVFMYTIFNIFVILKKKSYPSIFDAIFSFIIWAVLIFIIFPKRLQSGSEIVSSISMVQYLIIVCGSFACFYNIAYVNLTNEKLVEIFVIALGLLFVYNILHFDVASSEAGDYSFYHPNNLSYKLAGLFPMFLVFWNKKWLMLLLMISSSIFVLFLLKRGAILCVVISLLSTFYYLIKLDRISFKRKEKWNGIVKIVCMLLILAFIYAVYEIYSSNEILQMRLESGSSDRDSIYLKFLNIWIDSDFPYKIIGHGPVSTLSLTGQYAHSDWLEILTDFGIIGLFLYCMISVNIIRYYNQKKLNNQAKASLIACLVYIVIRSTFSMCVYELESLLVFGYMGYIIGKNKWNPLVVNKL